MTDSRDAIRDLMMRYARCTDSGEHDAVGELFAHGRFVSTLGAALGGAGLAAYRKRTLLAQEGSRTRHLTTNVMIDADEDAGEARARSYYLLLHAGPEQPLALIGCGRYYDRFERGADGAWRFAERWSLLDARGDLGRHVAGYRPSALPYDVPAAGPPLAELPPMPAPAGAHAAIETLIYGYAERVDLADFDGAGALFAHGEGRRFGEAGTPLGGPRLAATLRAGVRLHDGSPRTKHVTTNVLIELGEDGETASARSCFAVPQATRELPLQLIAAGRYHDTFARSGGAWRFRSRTIHLDHEGELGQHAPPESPLRR